MERPEVCIWSRLTPSVKIEGLRPRVCPYKLPSSTFALQNGSGYSPKGKSLGKFASACLKVEWNAAQNFWARIANHSIREIIQEQLRSSDLNQKIHEPALIFRSKLNDLRTCPEVPISIKLFTIHAPKWIKRFTNYAPKFRSNDSRSVLHSPDLNNKSAICAF